MKIFTVLILFISVLGNCQCTEKFKSPASFYILSGDLRIKFDSATFYNMKRIEYKEKLVGVDSPGTCYGTVFKFPELGFIGSGHIDNGRKEELESLEFYQDGKVVNWEILKNVSELKGNDFKLVKNSLINGIRLSNTIVIENNIIDEHVIFSSFQDIKLSLVYNFMHPFTTEMDQFATEDLKGVKGNGIFKGDGSFLFKKEMKWVAFYSSSLKVCAVSVLTENTCTNQSIAMLWDKPPRYRKFYLRSYMEQILTKDRPVTFHIRTMFADASVENWLVLAEKLSENLINKNKSKGNSK